MSTPSGSRSPDQAWHQFWRNIRVALDRRPPARAENYKAGALPSPDNHTQKEFQRRLSLEYSKRRYAEAKRAKNGGRP